MPRSTRRKTQKIKVKKLQPPKVKKGKSLNKRKVKVSRKKNKKGGMPPRRSRRGKKKPVKEAPVEEPVEAEAEPEPAPASPEPEPEPEPASPEPEPVEGAGGGARRDEPRVPVSARGKGYYQQMTEYEKKKLLDEFPHEQKPLLTQRKLKVGQPELERATAYFAAQPTPGPTQQQQTIAEFERGRRALGSEVVILSRAHHQSQEVARQMMNERNAMVARMSKMEQQHAATVAELQGKIEFLNEQLDRRRYPNRGGPPPGLPYGK